MKTKYDAPARGRNWNRFGRHALAMICSRVKIFADLHKCKSGRETNVLDLTFDGQNLLDSGMVTHLLPQFQAAVACKAN